MQKPKFKWPHEIVDMNNPKHLRGLLWASSTLLMLNSLALMQQRGRNMRLQESGQELVDVLTEAADNLGPEDWAKFANDFKFFQIIRNDPK